MLLKFIARHIGNMIFVNKINTSMTRTKKIFLLALVINLPVCFLFEYTNIWGIDHSYSAFEIFLYFFYLPQGFSSAALMDLVNIRWESNKVFILIATFIGSFPISWCYSLLLNGVYNIFFKMTWGRTESND